MNLNDAIKFLWIYRDEKILNKKINSNIYIEFEDFIRNGGFPGALYYDEFDDKITYISSVVEQIFEKDIKTNNKIKDVSLFEVIEKFIINNFGSIISVSSIYEYLLKNQKIKVDRRTLKRYIDILEKAKIIYSCDLFDIKSKMFLNGEKKYYLADFSIYYTLNTDNRISYGPMLENIVFNYLKSKKLCTFSAEFFTKLTQNIAKSFCIEYNRITYLFYIEKNKTKEEKRYMKKEEKQNFTKLTQRRGISLIVLIVTIIVVIILAAAVILTISKNNPVESAREARFKEDIRSIQDELSMYLSSEYTKNLGDFDPSTVNLTGEDMVKELPSTEGYKDIVEIQSGK